MNIATRKHSMVTPSAMDIDAGDDEWGFQDIWNYGLPGMGYEDPGPPGMVLADSQSDFGIRR